MKHIIFTLLAIAIAATASAREEIDRDDSVLSPEELEFYEEYAVEMMGLGRAARFKFPQTTWKECSDEITGNYYGYACSNKRNISVILKKYIDSYIYSCVDQGLKVAGGGKVNELHIVHAGITGDANHAPRSLHSENRAIDVKSLEIKTTAGALKKLVYEGTANRTFYTAFRKCWGDTVKKYNGCPLYKNNNMLTASIGWEDANHKRHLHLSVPYCVGGKYSSSYYQK